MILFIFGEVCGNQERQFANDKKYSPEIEKYLKKEEKRIRSYLKSLGLSHCQCCKENNITIEKCCNLLDNNIMNDPIVPT